MRKPAILIALVSFLFIWFSSSVFAFVADTSLGETLLSTDRVIVKTRRDLSLGDRLDLHRRINGEMLREFRALDLDVLRVRDGQIDSAVKKLEKDPRVLYAEPDFVASALELTDDPSLPTQWALYKIQAAGEGTSAWNLSKSNTSVRVAILDTGVDQNHDDLKDKIISNKNCTDSPTPDDLFGHGTHVAGIAAGATHNAVGIAGTGYNASIMNVKVLSDSGYGYYSWIANCIIWAADNGAKVISMSLGGSGGSKTLENAVNYAWGKGVVVVAAAGNSGNSRASYPAYYRNVIAVAATDQQDKKASWSNYGRWVDIAAPGVGIFSTLPNHTNSIGALNYGTLSGTSMATPHVAGVAVLLWSTPKGSSNVAVRKFIESSATKISGTGSLFLNGRINAYAAMKAASGN